MSTAFRKKRLEWKKNRLRMVYDQQFDYVFSEIKNVSLEKHRWEGTVATSHVLSYYNQVDATKYVVKKLKKEGIIVNVQNYVLMSVEF